MEDNTIRKIKYLDHENVIVFDSELFDGAIIDVFNDNNLIYGVYDYDTMLNILIKNQGMNLNDAEELINEISKKQGPIILFNTI